MVWSSRRLVMTVEVQFTDEDVERIATRVAELINAQRSETWLDVPGAAAHLAQTKDAIRALVKRRQIPFHRTENGRVLFSADRPRPLGANWQLRAARRGPTMTRPDNKAPARAQTRRGRGTRR